MGQERREFSRVPLCVEVSLSGAGKLVVESSTLDLSLRGARLQQVEELSPGDECELTLRLGEGEGSPVVELVGRVVRVNPDSVALEFLGIRGVESLDHLRRLVLFNAADAGKVEEEFRGHRGLRKRED